MTKTKGWLGEVEGLRGLASLWVFAFHVGIACGATLPFIVLGGRGVDLFILLSGFIMVHQFEQRKEAEPWRTTSTVWRFWIRRFFRLAPLYYPLLILSLASAKVSDGARDIIASHFPSLMTVRFTDTSVANILTHITFLFGLLPYFASRTPLPDWSIGLEVQFYAVFPLLMIVVLKFGYRTTIAVAAACTFLAGLVMPAFFSSFAMPAFLPLRLYLFGMGMLIAASMHASAKRIWVWLFVLPVAAHFALPGVNLRIMAAQIPFAFFLYAITNEGSFWGQSAIAPIRAFLCHRLMQKLGIISYSLYLIHLLVVFPVSAVLLNTSWFGQLPGVLRFLLSLTINACIVLPLSMLFYTFVEKPGVRLGKTVVGKMAPLEVETTPALQQP